MMRLRSDFWVSAYLRTRNQAGTPAVLRRRGAAEAGAIFVKLDLLNGVARLYGPAPPDLSPVTGERLFALVSEADPPTIEERIAREIRYDADLWLIEIEEPGGDPHLAM